MSMRLPEPFERALAPMRRVRLRPAARIHAAIRSVCGTLEAMELCEDTVVGFVDRALEAYGLQNQPAEAEKVLRAAIREALGTESLRLAVAPQLSVTRAERRWDFKELDNRTAPRCEVDWAPKAMRFPRPVTERPAPGQWDLRRRKRFVRAACPGNHDSRDPAMDHARVSALLRNIGKGESDGGDGPPDGGQPARI